MNNSPDKLVHKSPKKKYWQTPKFRQDMVGLTDSGVVPERTLQQYKRIGSKIKVLKQAYQCDYNIGSESSMKALKNA